MCLGPESTSGWKGTHIQISPKFRPFQVRAPGNLLLGFTHVIPFAVVFVLFCQGWFGCSGLCPADTHCPRQVGGHAGLGRAACRMHSVCVFRGTSRYSWPHSPLHSLVWQRSWTLTPCDETASLEMAAVLQPVHDIP